MKSKKSLLKKPNQSSPVSQSHKNIPSDSYQLTPAESEWLRKDFAQAEAEIEEELNRLDQSSQKSE